MTENLRGVAARAGVSVRTVSNVVSNFPGVAPGTRAAVQKVLDEVGYRPNLAARQLRRGRTGAIALIVPEIDSPYFSELAAAIVRRADARGWTVLIDQSAGDAERERRLVAGASNHLVDGLIFSPWSLTPLELAERNNALPMVLLGERGAGGPIDHVAIDNVVAATEATEHLIGIGRRRIAVIGAQPHLANDTSRQRVLGYREALRRNARAPDKAIEIAVGSLHRSDGAQAMQQLLEGPAIPDAVFCCTDELALGALRRLADHRLRVPEDVALVGFDDIEDGRFSVPTLSTVSPDKNQIAQACLDRLDERLHEPRRPSITTIAAHTLKVRQSSTPRPLP